MFFQLQLKLHIQLSPVGTSDVIRAPSCPVLFLCFCILKQLETIEPTSRNIKYSMALFSFLFAIYKIDIKYR